MKYNSKAIYNVLMRLKTIVTSPSSPLFLLLCLLHLLLYFSFSIFIFIISAVLVVPVVNTADASNFKIIAEVNGRAISNFEIYQKSIEFIRVAGLPAEAIKSPEVAENILRQIILVELKKQHAKSIGLFITPQELSYAINMLEKKRNLPQGGFKQAIEDDGGNYEVAEEAIEAELVWDNLIKREIFPKIKVSELEVNSVMPIYETELIKEVFLHEIVIPIGDGSLPSSSDDGESANRKAVRGGVQKSSLEFIQGLRKEIQKKALSFEFVAKQISISLSSKDGGEVGWVNLNSIDDFIAKQIDIVKIGGITQPILRKNTYSIFKITDKKTTKKTYSKEDVTKIVFNKKLDVAVKQYIQNLYDKAYICLLYTSPSPRDRTRSRMPSSA